MSYLYLAAPYSHADPFLREYRYVRTMQVLAELLTQERWAFSPIVHCHELAKIAGLPRDAAFWQAYNFTMLAGASELKILRLPGWENSLGIAAELEEAERLHLPVSYL